MGLELITFTWDSGPTTEDITSLTAGTYNVSIDNGACIGDTTFTILNVSGLFDSQNTELAVYPNPSNGIFTISLDGNFDYQIINILGDVIINENANNSTIVDISELSDGIYFVRLISNGAEKTVKLIKK